MDADVDNRLLSWFHGNGKRESTRQPIHKERKKGKYVKYSEQVWQLIIQAV